MLATVPCSLSAPSSGGGNERLRCCPRTGQLKTEVRFRRTERGYKIRKHRAPHLWQGVWALPHTAIAIASLGRVFAQVSSHLPRSGRRLSGHTKDSDENEDGGKVHGPM